MFKAVWSVLAPPQPATGGAVASTAGYEPIGDDEDPADSVIGSRRTENDKKVYWCFWALGAGVLLAWNVLICTIPLLSSLFDEGSARRADLASWLSTVYCFGNLFFLGLAQRDVGKSSPSPRLHAALLLLLVISLVVTFPLLPIVLPALSPSSPLLLPLLLLITLLLSVSTAYLQSAVFALAALWGSNEMLAVMSGQGGIAVLVSGAQVILAITSAFNSSNEASSPSSLAAVGLWLLASVAAFGCILAHGYLVRHPDYSVALASTLARSEADRLNEGGKGRSLEVSKRVFRKNILLEGAVAWVFVVTLSVFPPITSTILSVRNPPWKLLQPAVFIPLHFLLFNIGDYIGRTYLPAIPALFPTKHSRVLLLSLSRTIFIPIFFLCNVSPRPSGSLPMINSDVGYYLIIVLFGMSNGWVSSLSMILASSPILNPRITDEEKDVAGSLAAFCLVAGLAGGSLCSFGVNWLIRGNALG